jgi:hypothetical protein
MNYRRGFLQALGRAFRAVDRLFAKVAKAARKRAEDSERGSAKGGPPSIGTRRTARPPDHNGAP